MLLSHSDIAHLGALPYAKGKLGLDAAVYGTSPVHKMGQMFLFDLYLSKRSCEDFDVFVLNDVDGAFENFHALRYSQRVQLSGKGEGITITAYAAGHTVRSKL